MHYARAMHLGVAGPKIGFCNCGETKCGFGEKKEALGPTQCALKATVAATWALDGWFVDSIVRFVDSESKSQTRNRILSIQIQMESESVNQIGNLIGECKSGLTIEPPTLQVESGARQCESDKNIDIYR